MTLFVGGPYDGCDLPVDSSKMRRLYLPPPDHFDELFVDADTTGDAAWPHRYEIDESTEPAVFRYLQ